MKPTRFEGWNLEICPPKTKVNGFERLLFIASISEKHGWKVFRDPPCIHCRNMLNRFWNTYIYIIVLFFRCDQSLEMEEEGERGPEEGHLLIKIYVPELKVQKCLQFPRDQLVWDVKQQCLAALPKVSKSLLLNF